MIRPFKFSNKNAAQLTKLHKRAMEAGQIEAADMIAKELNRRGTYVARLKEAIEKAKEAKAKEEAKVETVVVETPAPQPA